MLLRVEQRRRIEWVLRAIVIASLAMMLLRSLTQSSPASRRAIESASVTTASLASWSTQSQAPALQLRLDAVPTELGRAWLGALAGAGSSLTWSGDPTPLLVGVEPVAAPTRGSRVLIAAPSASTVVVSDDVGPIDSIKPAAHGASITLAASPARISALSKGTTASAGKPDSLLLRRILVVGSASWETKFVTAALEEEGWKVDAMMRVAPGVDVGSTSVSALDTSRYSAVVAVDSGAAPYATRISQFVHDGGGLVIAADAAVSDAFAQLRAGAVGALSGESTQMNSNVTSSTLPVRALTSLRADAIPLQRTRGAVSLAARRVTGGRVVQLGVTDTWRLRMNGGDDGVREHRQLWTRLVSSVAYAPPMSTTIADLNTDPAPLADLVAAIGPAKPATFAHDLTRGTIDWMLWLFVLFAAAIVAEIASRRLRGAP